MSQQRSSSTREVGGLDTEYNYIAHVRALETFANQISRLGVSIPDKSAHVSFTSSKRLDMRSLKDRGLVWSYSIIRVRKNEEVIEEG